MESENNDIFNNRDYETDNNVTMHQFVNGRGKWQ